MVCDWFRFMLSIPRDEPMTKTEKFTQWSFLIAFVVGGITFLVAPELWALILQVDLKGRRSEGHIRLVGVSMIEIGLIFLIAARSNHKTSRHQECLTNIPGRLVYVNGMLLMMILRNMLPLSFALLVMVLDTSLALITLVIWCRDTEGASVATFFSEIFAPILQCHGPKAGGSILVIFCLGVIQFVFWLVLAIRPDFAQSIFHLDPFQGYSGGFLAAYFFVVSVHSLYHVVGASNVNRCLSFAFIFYRIVLNVPVFIILFLVDQIERNLFIFLMSFDVSIAVIIFIFLILEKRNENNSSEEMEKLNDK
ncbi:uncharacterized protein LOC144656069 [Oculina patagonica]